MIEVSGQYSAQGRDRVGHEIILWRVQAASHNLSVLARVDISYQLHDEQPLPLFAFQRKIDIAKGIKPGVETKSFKSPMPNSIGS